MKIGTMKIGTMFTGIGGVDLGAKNAGLELAWGIEHDAELAQVANRNLGTHVITGDVLNIDPSSLPRVGVLHASPPCTRISNSNPDAQESELDIALADKICHFLDVLKPSIFTLENVRPYRKSKSWKAISARLASLGYWVSVENCNAADFGVPQERHRMIVRAARDIWLPYLPAPEPWVSWYDSTVDLHQSLKPSKFVGKQVDKLPALDRILEDNIRAFVVIGSNRGDTVYRTKERPFFTVTEAQKGVHRIWTNFRVMRADSRCLMRWQSFPDNYETVKTRGIGNAVPPLMYEKIISQILELAA